jgi:hypothetical protein
MHQRDRAAGAGLFHPELRRFAGSMLEMIYRHPAAAPLLSSRRIQPAHRLEVVAACQQLLTAAALIETLVLMGVTYGLVSAFVTLHFHWTPAALVPVAFLILTPT